MRVVLSGSLVAAAVVRAKGTRLLLSRAPPPRDRNQRQAVRLAGWPMREAFYDNTTPMLLQYPSRSLVLVHVVQYRIITYTHSPRQGHDNDDGQGPPQRHQQQQRQSARARARAVS